MLENIYRNIEGGTITLHQLSDIKGDHLIKLLAAKFLTKERVMHVQQILEKRFNEYALFLERTVCLGLLCHQVDVPVKGEIRAISTCLLEQAIYFYSNHKVVRVT